MARRYLAMNRFGLGWRAGDAPLTGDPRAAQGVTCALMAPEFLRR